MEREYLSIVTICGRYLLTSPGSEELPEIMRDSSLNNIVAYGEGWLVLSPWRSRKSNANDDYTL